MSLVNLTTNKESGLSVRLSLIITEISGIFCFRVKFTFRPEVKFQWNFTEGQAVSQLI